MWKESRVQRQTSLLGPNGPLGWHLHPSPVSIASNAKSFSPSLPPLGGVARLSPALNRPCPILNTWERPYDSL